jgi:group II intron reverse transcriptase/maturase
MLLEPVYETDFLDVSYGFRPGRSPHDALEALWQGLMSEGGGWVLEVDIQSFFDELDRGHLNDFLDLRMRDGVIRRTIGKWLKAGVMEEGAVHYTGKGTPQGGVISPLLANVYLHELVDRWFEETVKPRLHSRGFLVRFADDMVFVFAEEQDAHRVAKVLPKRFERFGLRLHPEKTRLLEFRPPKGVERPSGVSRGPRGFEFLGFMHHWSLSHRKRWVVKRKTASSRLTRSVHRAYLWCRDHRHRPVRWQHQKLAQKLRGHYSYYGITGNIRSLERCHRLVHRAWRKWLDRRSQKAKMSWEKFNRLLKRYPLPRPRIVHRYT